MPANVKPYPHLDSNGRIRPYLVAGEGEIFVRCFYCNKILAVSHGFIGRVDMHCQRCKRTSVIQDSKTEKALSVERNIETSRKRLEAMGFQEERRPDLEQIAELMELRWQAHMKRRAKRSVEVAVGLRFDVLLRDGFRCRYCGISVDEGAMLHVDHVIPQSKGGPTVIDNLVTACLDCNIGKSDKTLEQ
jgi:5-methylcytosine-specific restriction endonuclease McrA